MTAIKEDRAVKHVTRKLASVNVGPISQGDNVTGTGLFLSILFNVAVLYAHVAVLYLPAQ